MARSTDTGAAAVPTAFSPAFASALSLSAKKISATFLALFAGVESRQVAQADDGELLFGEADHFRPEAQHPARHG